MSSNSVTLKSGDTIWGLVAARNPGASNAEIQKKTQAVLDANGLTWETARTLKAGKEINLGGTPTPANNAQGAAAPAAAAPANSLQALIEQFLKMQGQTQQAQGGGNPFGGAVTPGGGLDAFLRGAPQGAGSNALAGLSGNFTFGLAGGDVLSFANPGIILGNLGLTG